MYGASCGKGGISIGEKRKRANGRFLFALSWKGAREHSRHLYSPLTSTATLAYLSLSPTHYSPLPMSVPPDEPAQAIHTPNGALSDPVPAPDVQPSSLEEVLDAPSNPETLPNGHALHKENATPDASSQHHKDDDQAPADVTFGAHTDAIDAKTAAEATVPIVVEVRLLSCPSAVKLACSSAPLPRVVGSG